MSDDGTEEPRIPRPPTKAELDAVSEAQVMITDEWAPAPRDAEREGGARDPGAGDGDAGGGPAHGVDGEGI